MCLHLSAPLEPKTPLEPFSPGAAPAGRFEYCFQCDVKGCDSRGCVCHFRRWARRLPGPTPPVSPPPGPQTTGACSSQLEARVMSVQCPYGQRAPVWSPLALAAWEGVPNRTEGGRCTSWLPQHPQHYQQQHLVGAPTPPAATATRDNRLRRKGASASIAEAG